VVASPGVPPEAPPLAAARAAGVPIVSEIEVALRARDGMRYIAVTGTNGKTTTTALIGHLLRTLGKRVVDAGNIGTPLTEIVLREDRPEWIALELSSFQLHDTPSVNPAVGVMTNLAPDHLDRYASAEDYYADKALLFRNASDASTWVLNADDALVTAMAAGVAGAHRGFGIASASAEMTLASGEIRWNGTRILARSDLPLLGDHNVMNAMAASLAVIVADAANAGRGALARIAEGLRSFRAPPHRLETVGERAGVLWINDSKATNISSTQVAIDGMTRPTVLLLGGRHKGEPYTSLAPALQRIARVVLAYGEAAPIIEQDLGDAIRVERLGNDFAAVVARARALAQPGDVVLLSPACSSYDMFRNYEERGAAFRRLATAV
jgi:UDP-N-acetylmuramoylalanine--D-glutamate ligase